jgi:hypothetical protein
MTNQKSIRDSTFNTILNTKTHGVYNIIKTQSSIMKTIWIVFFTICAVYCIYQVTNIIITFSAYGVNQVSSIVFESPAQFPAVVICNLNAYDSNTADDEIDSILNEYNISDFKSEKQIRYSEDILSVLKANLDQRAIQGILSFMIIFW